MYERERTKTATKIQFEGIFKRHQEEKEPRVEGESENTVKNF